MTASEETKNTGRREKSGQSEKKRKRKKQRDGTLEDGPLDINFDSQDNPIHRVFRMYSGVKYRVFMVLVLVSVLHQKECTNTYYVLSLYV